MDTSSSSRVTVQYHDPSGVFPLISRDLASRLPLRNLNWKSPTRPLRSIDALHVEFVPDTPTTTGGAPTLERARQSEPNLWSRSANQQAVSDAKERRHQIPGLRQTPYLKLYILRCDDKETYKAESRKLLREWVRENTAPTESTSSLNKRKHHDAFEWLIIHVVIPDTIAASEPRWTADAKDPDELAERKSSAKWAPIKKTRTVLDKIRADFNPSSKYATERVAQMRPQKNVVPPELLPKTPAASPYSESPQEQENARQDLVGKFKTLILSSFDLRVSQYEDDIYEKQSQRSLPGWNFCTFFVLKEGLARGFEAVGLVEDALAIYDELSAGLDAAVRDDSSSGGTTFLGDMTDYQNRLLIMLNDKPDSEKVGEIARLVKDMFDTPLDPSKKDYRGMIVSSTISLFDFQSYIFSRQRALLFRLGNLDGQDGQAGAANKQEAVNRAASEDDLLYEADVCKRAAAFVSSNARILRRELKAGAELDSVPAYDSLVERVASSWMYSAADQVLEESATPSLPPLSSLTAKPPYLSQRSTSGSLRKNGAFGGAQGANSHPVRQSSLLGLSPTTPQQEAAGNEITNDFDYGAVGSSGLAELAAARAQLLLVQRRILETLAKEKGWVAGWAAIVPSKSVSDINLDEPETEAIGKGSQSSKETAIAAAAAITCPALGFALVSITSFQTKFEEINDLAIRHFMLGKRTKSAENLLGDYALLKFQVRDFATAAQYFSRVAPMYLQTNWSYIQAEMLRIYARCLKELHRKDEYMRVTLSLLSKIVTKSRTRQLPTMRLTSRQTSDAWLDEDAIDVHGDLAEVVTFSEELPYNFITSVTEFFAEVEVGQEVQHFADRDGFRLQLSFRHLLEDELAISRIRLRLVNATDQNQEIWLESSGDVPMVRQGVVKTILESNMTTNGRYLIDKLILEAKKLHFVNEFQRKPQQTALGITVTEAPDRRPAAPGPSLLLYPRHDALNASISLAPAVHLEKLRAILVDIDTGSTDLESLDLRLKPASAGLRLHTADTTLQTGEAELDLATGGTVKMGPMTRKSHLVLRVPYSLESTLNEVTIRADVHYQNDQGSYIFHRTSTITVELPLDVDVNDSFKQSALFSKFSVRTTASSPLLITSVDLLKSAAYDVHAMPHAGMIPVFEKQPACLTYKITRNASKGANVISKKDASLALCVQYHCLDTVVLEALRSTFETALSESSFASLQCLLSPIVTDSCRSQLSTSMLEEAVLLEEFPIPVYASIPWSSALSQLPASTRSPLQAWLEDWHTNHTSIPLPLSTLAELGKSASSTARTITIPVSVPCIAIVHTARLRLLDNPSPLLSTSRLPPLATVGQALRAEIHISHTRAWSEESVLGGSEQRSAGAPMEFVYQLQEGHRDIWLIGGDRRGRFSAREGEGTVFELVLIPLRAGRFAVPGVEVSIAPVATSGGDADGRRSSVVVGGGNGDSVTCETDYVSAGQTVLVVNETRTTSVAVVDGVYGPSARSDGAPLERASTDSRVSRIMA